MNPLVRLDDCLWSSLHFVILNIPPSRLPLFPCLAGLVWLATLSGLLLSWITHGMPRYPGQMYPIAFISDIASFELKPLFLVGSTITAVCFVITVAAVHVMRYEPGFALLKAAGHPRIHRQPEYNRAHSTDDMNDNSYGTTNDSNSNNTSDNDNNDNDNGNGHEHSNSNEVDDDDEEDTNITKTLRFISLLSVFAASTASIALILLSIMDTFRYHSVHYFFLQMCFSGLALQAAGTAVVYANEVVGFVSFLCNRGQWIHDWGKRSITVRVFASLSTAVILVEVFLCMTFIFITAPERVNAYRKAAILEWVIAFLGTIYLWLFGGFFLDRNLSPENLPKPFRREMHEPDPEHTPLIGNTSQGET
ncbi:uncharacterized protein ACHE_11287A [Aspergillus chevalieri]|uniref:CWH43-like N-terminal domain-containing protein n=1 Tax=Aspergillus chevalieri TaxID=182096 RepID=A0A7R7ZIP7_ASPCH|nr:uncharacterized protein ACHE_11287A [Aspergillus chevalieri]BCR83885.1 hypothetical protein ACHE_11287A [Aspergillus chevalieri]